MNHVSIHAKEKKRYERPERREKKRFDRKDIRNLWMHKRKVKKIIREGGVLLS